jgi:predicted choloylglycine hydrolase
MRSIPFTFRAMQELDPGPKWREAFEFHWPAYRRWFLADGEEARASYATSVRMLKAHMPELYPVYERLVELAGGGDLAARMLSVYKPPPFLAGCTQGVWTREGGPILVRNYDYAPSRLEGLIWHSRLLGRRVIAMSDCLWGVLDGMNDAGVAVSLTFGGRRVVGDGFGIPLILRYVLETCGTSAEAREVLGRVPCNLAHNVTVVDRSGDVVTAYLSPDREPVFNRSPVATNHQGFVDWPEQARATRTLERETRVLELLNQPDLTVGGFSDAFLEPELFSQAYDRGFGTLYTSMYRPADALAEFRWPGARWPQSFEGFAEGVHEEVLTEGSVA